MRFTISADFACRIAAREAADRGQTEFSREHLLIGVVCLDLVIDDGVQIGLDQGSLQTLAAEYREVTETFSGSGMAPGALRSALRSRVSRVDPLSASAKIAAAKPTVTNPTISPDAIATRLLKDAQFLAGPSSVGVRAVHLLMAVLQDSGEMITTILTDRGAEPKKLLDAARGIAAHGSQVPASSAPSAAATSATATSAPGGTAVPANAPLAPPNPPASGFASTGYLDRFCRDLTADARAGKLGPFIGRRKELLQIIQTLARKTKSNPVLVGEAGVGKTAIVEALALRIIEGKDDRVLKGKRIYELNMGALVGGAIFRGEFEERITQLIAEVKQNPDVILFIDELHNVMGAGAAGSAAPMDAANLLKPALGRGEFRCIGATTLAEFRKHIEPDSALERRFEKIVIEEPSRDEALEMLRGIRKRWEEYHQVTIGDAALEAAVDLSVAFDGEHRLPDKAIDLLDRAASRTRVPALSLTATWMRATTGFVVGTETGAAGSNRISAGIVDEDSIIEVLAEKSGMPASVIANLAGRGVSGASRPSQLLSLGIELKERIIGQDDLMEKIAQKIVVAHAGIGRGSSGSSRGPLAVLLLLGPTGVGKTETAKALADILFTDGVHGPASPGDGGKYMIRFDMSEFMEEHSMSRMIGAPPGYIGFDDDPQLTGRLRTRPYSVVLLDEIEKAHPRVLDLFLQLFDEGRITDTKGRTASGEHAIFVMTSNLGARESNEHIGFGDRGVETDEADFNDAVRKHFRPEMLNRIDEVVIFRRLSPEAARKILDKMLRGLCNRIHRDHGVRVMVDPDVMELILREGFHSDYGVRELSRTVERLLHAPLAQRILAGQVISGGSWQAVVQDGVIKIVG